jgi:hypothetical protein
VRPRFSALWAAPASWSVDSPSIDLMLRSLFPFACALIRPSRNASASSRVPNSATILRVRRLTTMNAFTALNSGGEPTKLPSFDANQEGRPKVGSTPTKERVAVPPKRDSRAGGEFGRGADLVVDARARVSHPARRRIFEDWLRGRASSAAIRSVAHAELRAGSTATSGRKTLNGLFGTHTSALSAFDGVFDKLVESELSHLLGLSVASCKVDQFAYERTHLLDLLNNIAQELRSFRRIERVAAKEQHLDVRSQACERGSEFV